MPENNNQFETNYQVRFDVPESTVTEFNVVEVSLTESLTTPGLQTSVICQSVVETVDHKDLDKFYNTTISINAVRPMLADIPECRKSTFLTNQTIYRISDRTRINYEIEQFTLHACDPSLLIDAKTWMNKSWKCTTPSDVVRDVLNHCIHPRHVNIEASIKPRDFISENIHPFQVIFKQAQVASSIVGPQAGQDPSFVHFMTYQNSAGIDIPTHNFRSLTAMAMQQEIFEFSYSEKGAGLAPNYGNPHDIMDYNFPCEWDLLSDILNGYDENGNEITGLNVINPVNSAMSNFGQDDECGSTPKVAITNQGSEDEQEGCPIGVETWLLKRNPRMALLDQDKIALRMTVSWNPILNVGRVIKVNFNNKYNPNQPNYGSGLYLITNLTHNMKMGGLGITVVDCVAQTVAAGHKKK